MTDSLVQVTSKQQFDDLLSSSRIVVADCESPRHDKHRNPAMNPRDRISLLPYIISAKMHLASCHASSYIATNTVCP